MVATDVIKAALLLACRAPSLHNSQPWRWVADGGAVRLFVDPNRVMYSADRRGREAIISCGAVLDHFRIAMAVAGWRTHVERFPIRATPALWLQSISLLPASSPMPTVVVPTRFCCVGLTGFQWRRHRIGNRWIAFARRRGRRRRAPGCDRRRRQTKLADSVPLTDALRLYDSAYHHELNWWTAPFESSEGIPHSSLVSAAETERVGVGRTFPVVPHSERRPGICEDFSRVVVLSTDGDTREDALGSGEMLSRVLVECTEAGMGTCTITHLTEVKASRHIVANLIDRTGWPQILVRIGIAPSMEQVPPSTPRRPLGDVLEFRSARS